MFPWVTRKWRGSLIDGSPRPAAADYCLTALVRQEQRETEADEHEPVPHGEAGGAEDALQHGDVTDAADEDDAECSGQEEPLVGEYADGEDALVVAADGEGVEELAYDDPRLDHGACFPVDRVGRGEVGEAEVGGVDAPEGGEAHAGRLDGAEEQEPGEYRTGQQPFGDGPGRAAHHAG